MRAVAQRVIDEVEEEGGEDQDPLDELERLQSLVEVRHRDLPARATHGRRRLPRRLIRQFVPTLDRSAPGHRLPRALLTQ